MQIGLKTGGVARQSGDQKANLRVDACDNRTKLTRKTCYT